MNYPEKVLTKLSILVIIKITKLSLLKGML